MTLKEKIAVVCKWFHPLLRSLFYNVTIRPLRFMISIISWKFGRVFTKAKTTSEKVLLGLIFFLSMLCISVISYASFYNLYIPTAAITRPVHLSFSVCPDGVGICSFPSTNVSLTERSTFKEVLGSGQVYNVIIDLEIPDCPTNRDLGMFMIALKMYDRNHHVSATSLRTALYKYRSFPMRILSLSVLSPLYFLGIYEEKQMMSIEMFSTFKDDFYHPSVGATVEIQNHRIQIYSCQLSFYAKFSGLKHLLYYWPVTSAVCGITFNFSVCVVLVIVAFFNKRDVIREIAQSLSQEKLAKDNTRPSGKKKKNQVTAAAGAKTAQSTPARPKEAEDIDIRAITLPVVQEPVDFDDVFDDNDSELMTELRQRRFQ